MKRIVASALDPLFAFCEWLTKHKKLEFIVSWVAYSSILFVSARDIWEWQYWLIFLLILFIILKEYVSGYNASEKSWQKSYERLLDACEEIKKRSKNVKKLR